MKINEIAYERKFNLGNFESAGIRIVLSPEMEEQGDWKEITGRMVKEIAEEITKLNDEISKKGKVIK